VVARDIQDAFEGSPYTVSEAAAKGLDRTLTELTERVATLRAHGKLTPETLRRYYGATRFQQVAESNAIEGSTLSVGDTELAIVKGVTLTGHDPAYVRDAVSLDRALTRLTEIAKNSNATDIAQVKELHELILDGSASAGLFRSVPVRLSGSTHRPPRTWEGVMKAMEEWQAWSQANKNLSPVLRASVLHAWLTHIHPFTDGNGRTSRAIMNLELIRGAFPSAIIRRNQDRERYLNALRLSDQAGDLSEFIELVIDRFNGALVGLETAAREVEGYDPAVVKLKRAQQRTTEVWNTSVALLFQIVLERLAKTVEAAGGDVAATVYRDALNVDEYMSLCGGVPVPKSWAFALRAKAPGLKQVERLAWIGFRTPRLSAAMGLPGVAAPSIFWSKRNPDGYPPWTQSISDAPGAIEMSITPGVGDDWHILDLNNRHVALSTTLLSQHILDGFADLMSS
jgi:Fic family protein